MIRSIVQRTINRNNNTAITSATRRTLTTATNSSNSNISSRIIPLAIGTAAGAGLVYYYDNHCINRLFSTISNTGKCNKSKQQQPVILIEPPLIAHDKVSIACCQLSVGSDKLLNLQSAETAIATAAASGANIIVLPEIFNAPYSNDSFRTYSERCPIESDFNTTAESITITESPTVRFLSTVAAKYNIYLIGGSIPEIDPITNKLYNTSLILNPTGAFIGKHRKIHLFDINIPNKMVFKESDTLSAGESVTIVNTEYGRLGIGICYDIRFSELSALMAAAGAQILIYPAAFNTTTGPLHWELLQRARAVDNQLFVITCSPARNINNPNTYQAWGHSSIINPWGTVLTTTDHNPSIITAVLNLQELTEIRQSIPIRKQKRTDLYQLTTSDCNIINKQNK